MKLPMSVLTSRCGTGLDGFVVKQVTKVLLVAERVVSMWVVRTNRRVANTPGGAIDEIVPCYETQAEKFQDLPLRSMPVALDDSLL